MDIHAAARSFEAWLASQTPLDEGDLRYKHQSMSVGPFPFLRATYYRWAQRFPKVCPGLLDAPKVLAIADTHLENFGTWRDAWGRLVWGANDFDEAYPLPYVNDLVRLTTSALLVTAEHIRIKAREICDSILEGYGQGLKSGGQPFVAGAEHTWVFRLQQSPSRDPQAFWAKLHKLPSVRRALPKDARRLLDEIAPSAAAAYRVVHRVAGLGNLGKPRFTALAQWQGAPAAWEVKAVTLSAAAWASQSRQGPFYSRILSHAIRTPDPSMKTAAGWVVRRLAPDCQRIELSTIGEVKSQELLLYAMGFELANVHLGSPKAVASIRRDLRKQPASWLRKAAEAMREDVTHDWQQWRA